MKRLLAFSLAAALPCTASAEALPTVIPTKPLEARTYHITVDDLPKPYASESVSKHADIKPLHEDAFLNVPEGFRVNLYAKDVNKPRWLLTTPEGDVLVAESYEHRISRLIDSDGDGIADKKETVADRETNGLNQPFGMDIGGGYLYVGNTDSVVRYVYKEGIGKLQGKGEKIADLPGGGYNQHWTRNLALSPDGKWLYVTVGSESNADVEPLPRAAILRMRPDGSESTVFASGLRNPLGVAFHPRTGELYTGVNERDKLGDDLVPDYITRVEEGKFYGWPYAYLRADKLDPRHLTKNGESTQPEKAASTVTPDVLLQAHSAVMEIEFADRTNFPARYRNGLFAALRGSWNRHEGTGYKLIYVPFGEDDRPTGEYEDFLTGFLTDPEGPKGWGRPVGMAVLPDGSLLFADEPNNRIFRVSYGPAH